MSKPLLPSLVLALLLVPGNSTACTWVDGHFFQVTALRGRVVGSRIGPLQHARWLRQSFARRNVRLSLFRYRRPLMEGGQMPLVKAIVTDGMGRFDFGEVPVGHYTLVVDDAGWHTSDWFDVQFTRRGNPTLGLTIDASPSFPDCSGGHEFVVTTDGASARSARALDLLRIGIATVCLVSPPLLIVCAIRALRRATVRERQREAMATVVALSVAVEWAAFAGLLALGHLRSVGAYYVTTSGANWFVVLSMAVLVAAAMTKASRGRLVLASFLVLAMWLAGRAGA
jgi:hypothetical protein